MVEVKEKISISKFIESYNKFTNDQLKRAYVREHIKTTYAPILSKKLILETMLQKSVVETPVKHIDMTVSKLNFVMAILILYTNIEPDKRENEDGTTTPLTWEAYDTLKSSGLYGEIMGAIGEDLTELVSVQEQVLESWQIANTSIEAYLNSLVEAATIRLSVAGEIFLNRVVELLNDEIQMKKVESTLGALIKKIK